MPRERFEPRETRREGSVNRRRDGDRGLVSARTFSGHSEGRLSTGHSEGALMAKLTWSGRGVSSGELFGNV